MPKVVESLENINQPDHHFVGTIAFKSEDITLPDGSKMALGIDGNHWVLIFQKENSLKVFQYSQGEKNIRVDNQDGTTADIVEFKKLINYFMANANTDQLVTYTPPK